jgi:oxidase EvaA
MNRRYTEQIARSLLAEEGPGGTVDDILAWVRQRNAEVTVRVQPAPFRELREWRFDPVTSNLRHETGKFFSIDGLHVTVDAVVQQEWWQPIINQPEVGYLGILAREIDGVLCFLLQAKIEPGNVNNVQLSPTLQATRSNYTQVHKGRRPQYLELFQAARQEQVILDQLQSEQGARFYRKRNRNIVLHAPAEVPAHVDFRWVTLGQIKRLLTYDNVVNMDTRTVVSGLSCAGHFDGMSPAKVERWLDAHRVSEWGRALFRSDLARDGHETLDDLISWLTRLKSTYDLQAERIPLRDVRDWQIGADEIARPDRRFFRVLGVQVDIETREVRTWSQPMVQTMQQGISVLVARRIQGLLHFLVQAKIECGNLDVVELAPTVQCLTGNYRDPGPVPPAFLADVLARRGMRVIHDTLQSEEGGRFYREQNRYQILLADDDFAAETLPPNYAWMTLGQIREFLRFNNYLNIQARSLLSALDYR